MKITKYRLKPHAISEYPKKSEPNQPSTPAQITNSKLVSLELKFRQDGIVRNRVLEDEASLGVFALTCVAKRVSTFEEKKKKINVFQCFFR